MKEFKDPEKFSLTWVKDLYGLVDWHNIKEILMTGMKPKDVIGFEEVPHSQSRELSPRRHIS